MLKNTTAIDVYLKNPNGTPMTFTEFAVKPVKTGFYSAFVGLVEDKEILYRTDNNGYVRINLWPLPFPYILFYTDEDNEESKPGKFLFYVPDVTTVVNLQDLLVVLADSTDKYIDTVLQQIIDAKVRVLASVDTATQAASSATVALNTATSTVTDGVAKVVLAQQAVSEAQTAITKQAASIATTVNQIQVMKLQNRLVLGSYTLWVDTQGNLRIINGTPTTDLDGTIVGNQPV